MIRNLLIISGVGLILAVVGISGAAALGGRDLAKNDWTWTVTDNEFGDGEGESFRMRRGPAEPDVTRTLAWTGGDRLQVEVPGDVVYIQGPEAGVVVTGPKALADRVRVAGGRLTIDDEADRHVERGYIRWSQNGIHVWSENDRLKITVTAPSVTTFEVTSSADLVIRDYDQPRLNLTISGSGEVTARGEAESVRIDISGSHRRLLRGHEQPERRGFLLPSHLHGVGGLPESYRMDGELYFHRCRGGGNRLRGFRG